MPTGIDTYCVSTNDICAATGEQWGLYRIRTALRDLPSFDGPKSNGRSFKLFKLSDVLPRLRAKKQWNDEYEAKLFRMISNKEFQDV